MNFYSFNSNSNMIFFKSLLNSIKVSRNNGYISRFIDSVDGRAEENFFFISSTLINNKPWAITNEVLREGAA